MNSKKSSLSARKAIATPKSALRFCNRHITVPVVDASNFFCFLPPKGEFLFCQVVVACNLVEQAIEQSGGISIKFQRLCHAVLVHVQALGGDESFAPESLDYVKNLLFNILAGNARIKLSLYKYTFARFEKY